MIQLLRQPVESVVQLLGIAWGLCFIYALGLAAFIASFFDVLPLAIALNTCFLTLLSSCFTTIVDDSVSHQSARDDTILNDTILHNNKLRKRLTHPLFFLSGTHFFRQRIKFLERGHHAQSEQMKEVNHAAGQVAQMARQVSTNVQEQSRSTGESAIAISQLQEALRDVNENMAQTHHAAAQTSAHSTLGREQVSELGHNIQSAQQSVTNAQQVMETLDEATAVLLKMSDSIRAISEKTNLLALNASIEAARAGDQGRGFAVVAEEVRALALRSHQTANEMSKSIQQVRHQSQMMVSSMSEVAQKGLACLEYSTSVGEQFVVIEQETAQVSSRIENITTHVEQQKTAIHTIQQHGQAIVSLAANNAEMANQLEALAEYLHQTTASSSV